MILQTIWFVLWAVLWIVYFILDGADLGAAAVLPFLARDDEERTAVLATIGPVWDGNEVWLVSAGGVTFAAFPKVYAEMFSSMYAALLLLLFSLILRGVAIEFRGHLSTPRWRRWWEGVASGASIVAALLLGTAFGNLWRGLPLDGRNHFRGDLVVLLNPYALVVGILVLLLFVLQGTLWVSALADGSVAERARRLARPVLTTGSVGVAAVLLWSAAGTRLGAAFRERSGLLVFPVVLIAGVAFAFASFRTGRPWRSWVGASVATGLLLATGFAGMYPSLLPARDGAGLTAFNASSSALTLKIMLVVAMVFVPLVIAYQSWAWYSVARMVREKEEGMY